VAYDDGSTTEHWVDDRFLALAYSTTVHKSQGNQYDNVIIVLDPSHGPLLNKEVLYTAVTRAKRRLLLVAPKSCVDECVRRTVSQNRVSLLPSLLLSATAREF
jgi:exodeoxyribonuclease V alpha subunit